MRGRSGPLAATAGGSAAPTMLHAGLLAAILVRVARGMPEPDSAVALGHRGAGALPVYVRLRMQQWVPAVPPGVSNRCLHLRTWQRSAAYCAATADPQAPSQLSRTRCVLRGHGTLWQRRPGSGDAALHAAAHAAHGPSYWPRYGTRAAKAYPVLAACALHRHVPMLTQARPDARANTCILRRGCVACERPIALVALGASGSPIQPMAPDRRPLVSHRCLRLMRAGECGRAACTSRGADALPAYLASRSPP